MVLVRTWQCISTKKKKKQTITVLLACTDAYLITHSRQIHPGGNFRYAKYVFALT